MFNKYLLNQWIFNIYNIAIYTNKACHSALLLITELSLLSLCVCMLKFSLLCVLYVEILTVDGNIYECLLIQELNAAINDHESLFYVQRILEFWGES